MLYDIGSMKEVIYDALCKSEPIRLLLLGSGYENREEPVETQLSRHLLKSFTPDESAADPRAYLCIEVLVTGTTRTTKNCRIMLYAVCHRSMVDTAPAGGAGTLIDRLCKAADEVLCGSTLSRSIGIGSLSLENTGMYKSDSGYYGIIMEYSIPSYR